MHPALRTDLVHLSFPQDVYIGLDEENRGELEDAAVGPILVSNGRVTFSIRPENLWDITLALDEIAMRLQSKRVRLDSAHPIPILSFHHQPRHPFNGKAV